MHTIWQLPDEASYTNCQFGGARAMRRNGAGPSGFYTFNCDQVDSHDVTRLLPPPPPPPPLCLLAPSLDDASMPALVRSVDTSSPAPSTRPAPSGFSESGST